MNIRRALTFLFQDPRWVGKLGIAMVLNLVPAALIGYQLITGSPSAASVLGDASASTLQATAFDVLWTPLVGLAIVPLYGFVLRITRNVVAGHDVRAPGVVGRRRPPSGWTQALGRSDPLDAARRAGPTCRQPVCPGQRRGMAGDRTRHHRGVADLIVVQPAAEARLAVIGSLAAGLDVPAAFATVRRNLGGYLRVLLVLIVGFGSGLGLSIGLVALVWRVLGGTPSLREIMVVGITVTWVLLRPYTEFVLRHLYGQVYARAQDRVSAGSSVSHRSVSRVAGASAPRRSQGRARRPSSPGPR